MTPEGTKSGNPSGGAAPKEDPESQNQSKSSRNVSRGIKAALVAAAVSTAVAAAARSLGSSGDHAENGQSSNGQDTERSSRVRDAVEKASKRGEPALSAGWRAAEDSLEPLARTGARRAGRYVGERSPEFVRETLMPPFIKGFNEARSETVRRGERGS